MSDDVRCEPIGTWPGDLTAYRLDTPFKADYTSTVTLLERELDAVGAQAVVVQLAVARADLRVNALRASHRPDHPGVILTFNAPRLGKVRFACDRFLHWHANLRAVALGMEALRRVDRYGITSDGQQYAGFRALESAESARGFASPEDAARYIARLAMGETADDGKVERIADAMLVDDELAATYYRRASRAAHPDAGGDEAAMARLNAARALLEETP